LADDPTYTLNPYLLITLRLPSHRREHFWYLLLSLEGRGFCLGEKDGAHQVGTVLIRALCDFAEGPFI